MRQVISLPMRNWNGRQSLPVGISSMLLVYLWGIETNISKEDMAMTYQLLVYLWGIETWNEAIKREKKERVISLPMRNWNEEAAQDMKEAIELLVYLWGIETTPRGLHGRK